MDCHTEPNVCLATKYYTFDGESKQTSEVPEDVKKSLAEDSKFPIHRVDNRKVHGPPAGPERECYENPGPASPMYCVRTATESWVGFKWYKFVDQPELANVFKSLPAAERDSVRAYMQARIENLHKLGKDLPFFDVPGGEDTLPKEKVSIDEALLMTPPAGMEVGYVPVPVYQRKKVRPIDCEVVVGAYAEEPEPISSDYYDEFPEKNNGREQLQCNGPGVDGTNYPGIMFPIPPNPAVNRLSYQYTVPLPDMTVADKPAVPFNNPSIELDDPVPDHEGDTGGEEEGTSRTAAPTPIASPTASPTTPPTSSQSVSPTVSPVAPTNAPTKSPGKSR